MKAYVYVSKVLLVVFCYRISASSLAWAVESSSTFFFTCVVKLTYCIDFEKQNTDSNILSFFCFFRGCKEF